MKLIITIFFYFMNRETTAGKYLNAYLFIRKKQLLFIVTNSYSSK